MFHVEHLISCPICNFKGSQFYVAAKDHTITKETFGIEICENCNFLFTNPRPSQVEIGRYYDSKDYISHSNTNEGLFNKIYHLIKTIAIRNKIKFIKELNPPGKKLLDIGCGTGAFLKAFKEHGWEVIGIEPNKTAREEARRNNIIVHDENEINNLVSNSFSIISLWHVLEHVHELQKRVEEIRNLLIDNGYAVIAVPNHSSWDSKKYGEYWAAFDVPRHLYHFSPENIKALFKQHELFHVKSIAMKFDSFYVSLLSEKYKKSSLGPIRAFFSGLKSNIQAKGNPEKYSSVIYVFQKKTISSR